MSGLRSVTMEKGCANKSMDFGQRGAIAGTAVGDTLPATPSVAALGASMFDFIKPLFSTGGFMPRWHFDIWNSEFMKETVSEARQGGTRWSDSSVARDRRPP